MAPFSIKEENHAALSVGAATRLPSTPYDTPRAAPCNNPEFRVDRTHAVGGVCKQKKRLYQNI